MSSNSENKTETTIHTPFHRLGPASQSMRRTCKHTTKCDVDHCESCRHWLDNIDAGNVEEEPIPCHKPGHDRYRISSCGICQKFFRDIETGKRVQAVLVDFDQTIFSRCPAKCDLVNQNNEYDKHASDCIGPRNEGKYEALDFNESSRQYLKRSKTTQLLTTLEEFRARITALRSGMQLSLDLCFTPIIKSIHTLGQGNKSFHRFVHRVEIDKSIPSMEFELYSHMKRTITTVRLHKHVPAWSKLKKTLHSLETLLSSIQNDQISDDAKQISQIESNMGSLNTQLEHLERIWNSWNGKYKIYYGTGLNDGVPCVNWYETRGIPLSSTRGRELNHEDFREWDELQRLGRAKDRLRSVQKQYNGDEMSFTEAQRKLIEKQIADTTSVQKEIKDGRRNRQRLMKDKTTQRQMRDATEELEQISIKLEQYLQISL